MSKKKLLRIKLTVIFNEEEKNKLARKLFKFIKYKNSRFFFKIHTVKFLDIFSPNNVNTNTYLVIVGFG